MIIKKRIKRPGLETLATKAAKNDRAIEVSPKNLQGRSIKCINLIFCHMRVLGLICSIKNAAIIKTARKKAASNFSILGNEEFFLKETYANEKIAKNKIKIWVRPI